ncbi:hypothetical protein [Marinobacter sp. KMM 10035]|uniref:hypothetical protein n=1 Tax=Marinobacter sp. KMM 10035 TaxID=3134034 RepID=UPI003979440C
MVATTTLMDHQLNRSSLDAEVDYIIDEARRLSGKDWQVIATVHRDQRLFRKPRVYWRWQLLVYVGGCLPWQVITCAKDRDAVFAYLAGVVSGVMAQRRRDELDDAGLCESCAEERAELVEG